MGFEPQVVESIERSRAKSLRARMMMVVLVALAVAATAFLAVFSLVRGRWIPTVVVLAAGLAAVFFYTGYVHRVFEKFTQPVSPSKTASLQLFREQLGLLSLSAGVEAPELVVLDIPTVNSVAFEDRGRPVIGISKPAAQTEFFRGEAEAVMAHELAHVLIGDTLKPHDFWQLNTLPYFALGLLALLAVGLMAFIIIDGAEGAEVAVFLLSYVFIIWLGSLIAFTARKLDSTARYDDVLADSLAATLTSDPETLRRAIEKLQASFDRKRKQPGGYCSNYLFIPPHDARKTRFSHWSLVALVDMLYGGTQEGAENHMRREIDTIELRIKNLEAIEQGHWPAFAE